MLSDSSCTIQHFGVAHRHTCYSATRALNGRSVGEVVLDLNIMKRTLNNTNDSHDDDNSHKRNFQ